MPVQFIRRHLGRIVVSFVLAAMAVGMMSFLFPLQRERRVAAQIKSLGGQVGFRYFGPAWIPKSIRDQVRVWDRIDSINMGSIHETALPVDLSLSIGRLQHLEFLAMGRLPITDEGLSHWKGLIHLQQLEIHKTKVTDAGMEHLKGLDSLQYLFLGTTDVGDTGIGYLSELRNLKRLVLDRTQITDRGLAKLNGLTNLRHLDVRNTQTSESGREMLRNALPKCHVEY